jgi:hypothetical protein
MYIKPRMRYKGNLTKGRQKWREICKGRWFSMKSSKNFWRRPRESSLSIMKMSSKKILNSRSNILCFK